MGRGYVPQSRCLRVRPLQLQRTVGRAIAALAVAVYADAQGTSAGRAGHERARCAGVMYIEPLMAARQAEPQKRFPQLDALRIFEKGQAIAPGTYGRL